MRATLRRARAYLYTGTQPASYTLGLIEAMMTGVPVVSIGPSWMRVFPYGHELFEGHELATGDDTTPAVQRMLRPTLDDLGFARRRATTSASGHRPVRHRHDRPPVARLPRRPGQRESQRRADGGRAVNVLADRHHSGLYHSLQLLAARFGWTLYTPVGHGLVGPLLLVVRALDVLR
jgi:hypothetical protein